MRTKYRLLTGVFLATAMTFGAALLYRAGPGRHLPEPSVAESILSAPASASSTRPSVSVVQRIRESVADYGELDPFKQADVIRQWIYAHADVAASPGTLLSDEQHPIWLHTLDENFQPLFDDQGGYWCGGVAYLASQAYTALGFKAVTYNCGNPQTLTHVVTLVKVEGQWYVQDAYFNLTYVDDEGRPLPFLTLLRNLVAGKLPKIANGTIANRDVHVPGELHPDTPRAYDWTLGVQSGARRLKREISPSHFVYRSHATLSDFLEILRPDDPTYQWLEREGLPKNLACLFLFPLGVNRNGMYYDKPEQIPLLRTIEQTIATARAAGSE